MCIHYIELSTSLNSFEMFVSSLIHEKNIENVYSRRKTGCSEWFFFLRE